MKSFWQSKLERIKQVGDLWTVRFWLKTQNEQCCRIFASGVMLQYICERSNSTSQYLLNTQSYSSGIYLIRLTCGKGCIYSQKFSILH
jgi:hypothetical protein